MGSWCELRLDALPLAHCKSHIDDDLLSIFQEKDRRDYVVEDHETGDEARQIHSYVLAANLMRERLDSLGFTLERARLDYAVGHADALEIAQMSCPTDYIRELDRQTYDRWCGKVRRLTRTGDRKSIEASDTVEPND